MNRFLNRISKKSKIAGILALAACLAFSILSGITISVHASETTIELPGSYYEFEEKTKYTFSEENSIVTTEGSSFGMFSVSGDISETSGVVQVKNGNVSLHYSFQPDKLNLGDAAWHVTDDKTKEIDVIKIKKNIASGVLILQSSLDGISWTTDVELTDVFAEAGTLNEPFYVTKDIQQENGCYFRVIIAYKLQRKVGAHKVAFITVDDNETKRIAEVYSFYVANGTKEAITSAKDTPRKELGSKIKAATGKGYSGEKTIDSDDPHYGWDLGNFTVNGFTRETNNKKYFPGRLIKNGPFSMPRPKNISY